MILFDGNGNRYRAEKARRPRFSTHGGRTWDFERKRIDGAEVQFWYDTSWGTRYRFRLGEQWYSLRHWTYGGEPDATEVGEFLTAAPQKMQESENSGGMKGRLG